MGELHVLVQAKPACLFLNTYPISKDKRTRTLEHVGAGKAGVSFLNTYPRFKDNRTRTREQSLRGLHRPCRPTDSLAGWHAPSARISGLGYA